MIKLYGGKKINHFKSAWFRFTAVCGVNNIIAARLPAARARWLDGKEKFAFSNVAQPHLGQELQKQLWGIILRFD